MGTKYNKWIDMGINQTTTTKYRYWLDQTIGIKQTEQSKIRVLPIPNSPKYGFFQDRTDRIMGII